MNPTSRRAFPPAALRHGGSMLLLLGCATARPEQPVVRLVSSDAWGTVVDCVALSARASELYVEFDTAGISVTPGFTPLAQNRAVARAGVVGTVRVTRVSQADGLRITAEALNWDPPAVRRDVKKASSATRAVAKQLDAQCLSEYPIITTD
jgi:hypothetical protein